MVATTISVLCTAAAVFPTVMHWLWQRLLDAGFTATSARKGIDRQPHKRLHQGTVVLLILFAWLGVSTTGGGALTLSAIARAALKALFQVGVSAVALLMSAGHSHFEYVLLGIYSGLVAVCGTCFYVRSSFLPLIGSVGASLSLMSQYAVCNGLRLNNARLASALLTSGCWGSAAIALFADKERAPVPADSLLVESNIQQGEVLCEHVSAMLLVALWALGATALFLRTARVFSSHLVSPIIDAKSQYSEAPASPDPTKSYRKASRFFDSRYPGHVLTDRISRLLHIITVSVREFRRSVAGLRAKCEFPVRISAERDEAKQPKKPSREEHPSRANVSDPTCDLVQAPRRPANAPSPFAAISLEHASWVRGALFFAFLIVATSASIRDPLSLVDSSPIFVACDDFALEVLTNMTGPAQDRVTAIEADLLSIWRLFCGIIVFSMQLGFCFLEAGNVRSGSVITIIFKNLADCALGGLCWWAVGYGLAQGESFGMWGWDPDLFAFSPGASSELFAAYPSFFLSYTYMTAACTIISGATAERISFGAYCAVVVGVSSLFYPACAHWMWSTTGFLSPFSENKTVGNGVLDFSGSIVIHLYGGVSAVTLAYLIGPRALRDGVDVFSAEGRRVVEPHNKFQLVTGTLLLWFAWFAFNGGSVVSMSHGGSVVAGNAMLNTLLAGSGSTFVGALYSKWSLGIWDISICCNSALVGLVSITAGCSFMSPPFAVLSGIVSVPCYIGFSKLTVYFRIDDVVEAGAVHAAGGIWGGLAVGLFADAGRIQAALGDPDAGESYGLFLGGGVDQVAVQLVGILCVIAWAMLTMFIVWLPLRLTTGLRVSVEDEYSGLDISKHKCHSYDYIEKLELERTSALESVKMARNIAETLVSFDTEKVKDILVSHQRKVDANSAVRGHDNPLLEAFRSLADNLEGYRPYLPDSLMDMAHENQEAFADKPSVSVPAPGKNGSAALVFTDIQNSTASWEACPEGMSKGLKLHNQVMRRCIDTNHGYEVKTIGDAFMVAFDSIIDAVKFALDAHVELYHAPWPKELLEVPYCAKDAEVAWAGPRVRIGVHCGEVDVEMNNVVGRCDYFGGTVNRAARVEGACVGGAVCVTSDVLEKIASIKKATNPLTTGQRNLDLVGDPLLVHMGPVPLKGAGVSTLSLLLPQALAKRKGYVEQALKAKQRTTVKRHSIVKRTSVASTRSMAGSTRSIADGSTRSIPDGQSDHGKKRHHDFMKEKLELVPTATAGRVELEYERTFVGNPEESVNMVNEALSRVLNCLDRTEGTVAALVGMSLACGWNTTKKTALHFDNALRFVGMLYSAQARLNEAEATSRRFYVGIATGTVLVGNVGTQLQRFVSVIGPCVKLSGCLAFTARDIDVFCLAASLVHDELLQSMRQHARPIDRWHTTGGTACVNVYQVRADGMKQLFVTDDGNEEEDWSWSEAYWAAYESEDHESMLSGAPRNPIVAAVAVRLREKISLRPPLRL